MGLTKKQNKTFLSINANGKIAQSVPEGTKGAVSRTLDNGRVVHQLEHDGIEGRITGMYFKEHPEFGKSLNVIIDDEYALQLKCGSRYYYSFVKALPNVDLNRDVQLAPWRKEIDGKVRAALYINQGGKDSVKWYFTQGDPKGMPDMVKVKVKGKETWDDTAMQEFFEAYLQENIFPKFHAGTDPGKEYQDAEAAHHGEPDEELPF